MRDYIYKNYLFAEDSKWYEIDPDYEDNDNECKDHFFRSFNRFNRYILSEVAPFYVVDSYNEYLNDFEKNKHIEPKRTIGYMFDPDKYYETNIVNEDVEMDENTKINVLLSDNLKKVISKAFNFMNSYLSIKEACLTNDRQDNISFGISEPFNKKDLLLTFYKNGLYLGTGKTPYLILIGVDKAVLDLHELFLHPDTIFILPDAFKAYHHNNQYLHLNKLILPKHLNCSLACFKDLSVDILYLDGSGKDLYNDDYLSLINNKLICAYRMNLNYLLNDKVKAMFLLGYLKHKKLYKDQEIIDQYESYLKAL